MEALKDLRRRKGWSQKDLSEHSGVGQDTISGIESGRHEPRPSTLRKLAGALDVEVADFFRKPAPLVEALREAGRTDTRTGDERLQDRLAPRVARLEELDLGELHKRRHELGEWLSELKRKVDYGAGSKEEITNDDAYLEITDELLALMTVLNKNASKQLFARDSDS